MKIKSCEEIKLLIKQLRDRLQDVFPSNPKFDNDYYLYRWLMHHQMKVDRTEKIIRESIEWRKQMNIDELAEREWAFFAPGLEKEVYIHFEGCSKSGKPVSTTNGEGIDIRKLAQKYGKDALGLYFIQLFAKLEKRLLDHYKHGPRLDSSVTDCTLLSSNGNDKDGSKNWRPEYNPLWDSASLIHITSYKNISPWSATSVEAIQSILEGARAGMTYFPATVSTVYMLNLNKFTSMIVKLIKPILSSGTFDFEVFDTDQNKWSKVLLEHIDADQLQTYFGGTKIIHRDARK